MKQKNGVAERLYLLPFSQFCFEVSEVSYVHKLYCFTLL